MNYNVNFIDPQILKLTTVLLKLKKVQLDLCLLKEVFLNKENYTDLKFTPRPSSYSQDQIIVMIFLKLEIIKIKGNVNYLSEDFYFSTLWRDIGGKIFADLT